jgi:methionyl aminopeptidase
MQSTTVVQAPRTQPPAVLPHANDPCWCGSGRKYKRCHRSSEGRVLQGIVSPRRPVPASIARPPYADTGNVDDIDEPRIKSADTIERMRITGRLAAEILRLAGEKVQPGVATEEIDAYVHELCIERDCYPSPLNYNGFPKSVCTSVNEVICHGIPDSRTPRSSSATSTRRAGSWCASPRKRCGWASRRSSRDAC